MLARALLLVGIGSCFSAVKPPPALVLVDGPADDLLAVFIAR